MAPHPGCFTRKQAIDISATVEVRSAPLESGGLLEPGVVGLWRPILLLPAGIAERLTPPQLKAVLAHELCHIRRRDNLTSAIHMIVEAVFWFHPLVWWIGARLIDERERACDEEVLLLGCNPQVYAEGILNVCKLYVESPLECVSGVTGSDLKKRIEAIMTNRIVLRLNFVKKVALVAAGMAAVAAPIVVGMMNPPSIRAQSQTPKLEVAINQKVISTLLRRQGCSITLAVNGDEAYRPVLRSRFDLILTDVQMPAMDGLEATALIRREETSRLERGCESRTPIMALTAHTSEFEHHQCLAAGMDLVLTKPVSLQALLQGIHEVMVAPAILPATT
jgi:CheY-like chemotaxis protein